MAQQPPLTPSVDSADGTVSPIEPTPAIALIPPAVEKTPVKTPTAKVAASGGKTEPKAAGNRASASAATSAATVPASAPPAKAPPLAKAAAAPARAKATRPLLQIEVEEEPTGFAESLRATLRSSPSWLTSMIINATFLLVLMLIPVPEKTEDGFDDLVVDRIDQGDQLEELDMEEPEKLEFETPELVESADAEASEASLVEVQEESVPSLSSDVELSDLGDQLALSEDLMRRAGTSASGDLDMRGEAGRKMAVAAGGGSDGSEKAVAAGLDWLAKHQYADGSWNFDHAGGGACQGKCDHAGTMREARNGATGLALLPFLGAGNTHREGKYRDNVRKGLLFLGKQMQGTGGSLFESGGSMYSHGICAIALCEAYAMTQDKNLFQAAQQSINFTVNAQDPVGGGWRYTPRQPGDTSAVGWQIMALKSAHMGYLAIPPQTIKGAENFLNTVQSDGGAAYGYDQPGVGQATTAVGLLCRMYLGWKRENPALQKGVALMDSWGPAKTAGQVNMYYNYYATQVMHHWEGDEWQRWNAGPNGNDGLRDFLVSQQTQEGHAKGSWYMQGDIASDIGGRLYSTALAVMTLEVYYRHLPLYRKQSTEDEFEE